MAKEYFSHDHHARDDRKMIAFIHEFKASGYGIYWAIVERLHEEGGYLDNDEITYIALAKDLEIDIEQVQSVIHKCIHTYKLFTEEDGKFTAARVLRNGEHRQAGKNQRSVAGKNSAAKRGATAVQRPLPTNDNAANETSTGDERTGNGRSTTVQRPLNKGKERKVKESKGKKSYNPTGPKEPKAPSAAENPPRPEKDGKKGDEQPPEPFWQELVQVWSDFVLEKFGERPLFAGQDPKFFKSVIAKLKQRAAAKKAEWTVITGPERLRDFLKWAFTDEWLAKNFILKNLDAQFEKIGRDPKKIAQDSKRQPTPVSEQDLEFLYARSQESDFNPWVITTAHFDFLQARVNLGFTDEIRDLARQARIKQVTGSNLGPEIRLLAAYQAKKPADQSPEVAVDIPKLEALAKRIAVREYLLHMKSTGAVKLFPPGK